MKKTLCCPILILPEWVVKGHENLCADYSRSHKMEDDLSFIKIEDRIFFPIGRQPHFFENGRQPKFLLNGR
jgi:hypothetical protein